MAAHRIVSASEFKAKCLDIFDRIRSKELERVVVTKRGVPVALVVPPPVDAGEVARLHGFLRGSVVVPPEIDLAAPVSDEAFAADEGVVHR